MTEYFDGDRIANVSTTGAFTLRGRGDQVLVSILVSNKANNEVDVTVSSLAAASTSIIANLMTNLPIPAKTSVELIANRVFLRNNTGLFIRASENDALDVHITSVVLNEVEFN